MPRVHRLVVIALILVILGVQLAVILPPMVTSTWYWPFLNYPMYSVAHYRGDEYVLRELRAVPCDPTRRSRAVSARDLGFLSFRFESQLKAAVSAPAGDARPPSADSSVAVFDRIARKRLPGACRLQVWQQRARLGDPDTYRIDGRFALAREWSIRDGIDATRDRTDAARVDDVAVTDATDATDAARAAEGTEQRRR